LSNNYLENLFSLKGKTALITGGSSGIGFSMAQALGQAGAQLILVARRENYLKNAVETLKDFNVKTFQIDLESSDFVEKIKAEKVDILINAAGMNLRQPFQNVTAEAFDTHMNVHVRAPFLLTQRFAPQMAERGFGRIINIASLQSYRAFANSAPYGAAKGAVIQLTRAIAQEWSKYGVNCNAIAPGFFPTELTKAVFENEALVKSNASKTAIGRNGELHDLAGATIFLSSPASAYITGQVLAVDGGFLSV
jgi:NAD(P)-dependent dehydrogenase (short-subunit alcohol dehydrogenase family)